MRVQTEEWRRFIPGVRMYKGKLTYFYNGEILWNDEDEEYLVYDEEEREKWEVIMVLPGVKVIPIGTFRHCDNLKTVIMSDSVKRIEYGAFEWCGKLKFVRLSKTLEYIGHGAFQFCKSIVSIFIPESCREIGKMAFCFCKKLIIFNVPRNTTLGRGLINATALSEAFHFKTNKNGGYTRDISNKVNEWIKNLNQAEEFTLHRESASMNPPSEDDIYGILKQQGLPSLYVKNQIGLTALEYFEQNPYTENEINQHKLIKRLVLDLMGEIIA